eukprot:6326305-Alexandrium_andersonii.AAC.1
MLRWIFGPRPKVHQKPNQNEPKANLTKRMQRATTTTLQNNAKWHSDVGYTTAIRAEAMQRLSAARTFHCAR